MSPRWAFLTFGGSWALQHIKPSQAEEGHRSYGCSAACTLHALWLQFCIEFCANPFLILAHGPQRAVIKWLHGDTVPSRPKAALPQEPSHLWCFLVQGIHWAHWWRAIREIELPEDLKHYYRPEKACETKPCVSVCARGVGMRGSLKPLLTLLPWVQKSRETKQGEISQKTFLINYALCQSSVLLQLYILSERT